MKLLRVSIEEHEAVEPPAQEAVTPSCGSIHIELRGKVRISVEGHADPAAIRAVLEVLRVIDFLMKEQGAGTRIWIAAGVTDMRHGFQGLAAQVQTALEQQTYSGHIFIFRERRGDKVKFLWFDGDGLCLFQKRLEQRRFVWPQAQVVESL